MSQLDPRDFGQHQATTGCELGTSFAATRHANLLRRCGVTKERRDWRELCAAVAKEQDQTKLPALLEQLLAALDDREHSRNAARPENANAD